VQYRENYSVRNGVVNEEGALLLCFCLKALCDNPMEREWWTKS
jgi:hypothetical protein